MVRIAQDDTVQHYGGVAMVGEPLEAEGQRPSNPAGCAGVTGVSAFAQRTVGSRATPAPAPGASQHGGQDRSR